MGISTFTSKEFVIFCRVSKIGNEYPTQVLLNPISNIPGESSIFSERYPILISVVTNWLTYTQLDKLGTTDIIDFFWGTQFWSIPIVNHTYIFVMDSIDKQHVDQMDNGGYRIFVQQK